MSTKKMGEGTFTGVDKRRKLENGQDNPNFDQPVSESYTYEYTEFDTDAEVAQNFSPSDLRKLANQREKATANSGERQKVAAKYAPQGEDAAYEEAIASAIKLAKAKGKTWSREQAQAYVDSQFV